MADVRDYHSNFDEIINAFIVKNGVAGFESKSRLSAIDRSNAIIGVAFVLRLACADDPSSAVHAEKLLKEGAKRFGPMLNMAKEFFPDIDFSDVAAEVSAEQL